MDTKNVQYSNLEGGIFMRKGLYWSLMMLLALLFCGCANPYGSTTMPTYPIPTTQSTDALTTAPTVEVPETTVPAHSALYLPAYTAEQILEYFEEVVLHMEYTDGTGNPALVQKWIEPLRYRIIGEPTQEDLTILTDTIARINEIEGFPGIYPAGENEFDNLTFRFLDPEDFRLTFSDTINGEDAYGATQFWYGTKTNDIYMANIGYRTDLDQATRSSIIIEEIVNTLGISDTEHRTDSIVYQYSNDNMTLSDVDWIILKLLYSPEIQCGMDAAACEEILRELYY